MNKIAKQKTLLREEDVLNVYCETESCQPKNLQCCVNIKVFTFFVSISSLLSYSLTMYLSSQVTTLEKYFNFNSSQSGVLLGSNDIGFLVSVLIFSYALKNCHIPRILGVSSVVYGIAGIVCALPYFFSHVPFINRNRTEDSVPEMVSDLCELGNIIPNETASSENNNNQHLSSRGPFAVIAIGMIMQGISKATRLPLLSAYIDDNVEKTKTGAYMGTIIGVSILGPALAFLLGGLFSSIYVTLGDTDLSPNDSHWIGAWWLGFIVFGILSLAGAIPLFFFPKRMKPKGKPIIVERESLKKILQTSKRLLTNPLFVCMCCFAVLRAFTVAGSVSFLPKYFETQFHIPSWKANVILGYSYIPATIGSILGGSIAAFFKMGSKGAVKCLFVLSIISWVLMTICPAITCPQPQFVDTRPVLSLKTPSSNQTFETQKFCLDCECDSSVYDPVCGEDGQNYISPCRAGCQKKSTADGYENCSCIGGNHTAIAGVCPEECHGPIIIATIGAIRVFLECLCAGPNVVIMFRSVLESDRTFAMGILSFSSSLLGWLPGPPSHGALIDTFCKKWRHLPNGALGDCTYYDLDAFRIGFYSLQCTLHFVSEIFILIVCYYALCTKRYFREEEQLKNV